MGILTIYRFPMGEYNKLASLKIGSVEIIEKINSNAYRLKLSSNIRTSDIFNIEHRIPFTSDCFDEDLNLRANSIQLGEDDVDRDASNFLRKIGVDVSVVLNNLSEERLDEMQSNER